MFSFVFRRPFAEQVAFFRGKLGNLVPTATWKDIQRSQHDRAFMVAGAAKADLLADLAAAVDKAIAEGESLDTFRRRFGEIVEKRGWHGWTGEGTQAGTNWRTRVIYRTNMATSYAAGRLAQLQHFPLWVYRHSGAEHPRLQHKAWDGLTLPADHPFWQTHYPPNGWGCGCRVVGASSKEAAARLGGNPDYDTPPAGWDARDANGRMPGIDEGWDYSPGSAAITVDNTRIFIAKKLKSFPEELRHELKRDIAYSSADQDVVEQRPVSGRINVEIIRSTEKAYLVRSADGREAWIQRRWMKDGSVGAEIFDKKSKEMAARMQSIEARRAGKDSWHKIGPVLRETEKAVAVEARWEEESTGQKGTRLIWFPKSQLNEGAVKGWLIEAKARDLRGALSSQYVTMKISIAGLDFWL